ncbi:diphthine methyl ester synthase [Danaus plexippus]|uniref:diphthine methyl ester synthase n=1 Tax=Danaus plexippus plexippus TaxID=278856 RepID=A0A212ENP1_DANPL|nr:diphthine methyl ester synthase [Danaus plexippus]OWR43077.1 diphthine synthase [Danaus plexippus plexippus]
MFYLIGLGLGDAKDVTVKGLEIIRKCDKVFLEAYTSILTVGKEVLEEFYQRPLIIADRDLCESNIDEILKEAKVQDIALLVVGDPLGATTHTDMLLRAKDFGVETMIVHNASIMNAVSCCGLQLYNFGETVSIPFWSDTWKPDSFFEKIIGNYSRNLHTLCLLDIKVKEPTEESLTKKVRQYMDPKFMSVKDAARQLVEIIANKNNDKQDLTPDTLVVGLSRVGALDQKIVAGSLEYMQKCDLGPPLHSLVIPAPNLHPLELEYLAQFR